MRCAPVPAFALAAAALAGAALPAAAQSFEGRLGFTFGHGLNAPLVGEEFLWFELGGYEFQLAMGAFDVQGFTSYGILNWTGDITISGTGVNFTHTPPPQGNRAPFTFNPLGNGVPGPGGISGIDAVRNPINIEVPWPMGEPAPPPPTFTEGSGSYYNTHRFTVELLDNTPRDILITATGSMQVISGWTLIGGQEGGTATYTTTSFVTDPAVTASFHFTHDHIPAPGAATALGLGMLAAARRRR